MEKIVNEIYSQCEESLDSSQIERLISDLESLLEIKQTQEDKKDPFYFDSDPSMEVDKENCSAL